MSERRFLVATIILRKLPLSSQPLVAAKHGQSRRKDLTNRSPVNFPTNRPLLYSRDRAGLSGNSYRKQPRYVFFPSSIFSPTNLAKLTISFPALIISCACTARARKASPVRFAFTILLLVNTCGSIFHGKLVHSATQRRGIPTKGPKLANANASHPKFNLSVFP